MARRAWGLAPVEGFFVRGCCGLRLAVVRGTLAVRLVWEACSSSAAKVFLCGNRTGVNGGGDTHDQVHRPAASADGELVERVGRYYRTGPRSELVIRWWYEMHVAFDADAAMLLPMSKTSPTWVSRGGKAV